MSKLRIKVDYASKVQWMFCDLKSIKTILDLSARIKERYSVEELFLSRDDTILPDKETIEILNNGDLIKVNPKKKVKDKSDNSLDCDDATKNSTEEGHVINMDIEEDEAEDHRQMSPEATSPSPPLQPEVNNKEEDKHLRKIVHSKSLDDLSPEENRAKQYESSQVTANTGKDAVAGQLTSSESYNNFLYWRDPLPVLDDLDDLKTSEDAAASAAVNETVKTASTAVEETATTLDNAGEKKGM